MLADLKRDFSLQAFIVAIVSVIIGITGPMAVVFQAAHSGHLSPEQTTSWIWALCFSSGFGSLILSLIYRAPIICAYSTAGAVLLIDSLPHFSYAAIIGAYIFSALGIVILGFSGIFEKIIQQVPRTVATGMLAGILVNFGIKLFTSLQSSPTLVIPTLIIYILGKRFLPKYTLLLTFVFGSLISWWLGQINFSLLHIELAHPILTLPSFSIQAIISVGLPLMFVALAAQYAPGVSILQTSGYHYLPISKLIAGSSLFGLLFAPFGQHSTALAAITAAIATGPEAHPDIHRRYITGIILGFTYLILGSVATAISSLFLAIPSTLVSTLAGLSLLGPIGGSLAVSMGDPNEREAGLITFLLAASGITFLGIGSAFWALLVGVIIYRVLQPIASK